MKEKILYIEHSYHKKTKSSLFLIDYLSEFYDVEIFYDDSWETNIIPDFSFINDSYAAVIFFQLIPPADVFKKIKHSNIVYFPMYDQSGRLDYSFWLNYKNCKIFNFSKTLHTKLTKWGFNSEHARFFIEPKEFVKGESDEVFFWQRLSEFNINTIEKLFPQSGFKIHLHKAIDPGHEFVEPTAKQLAKYSITFSTWFDTKKEMCDFIKSKEIYIAPREYEGIGMSFLEAMAMGKAVIAVDNPTMNEYITHNKNGYLFNLKHPTAINLKNIEQVQEAAFEFMQKGYQQWVSERIKIIEFIQSPNKDYKLPIWKKFILSLKHNKALKIKTGKNAYLYVFGHPIIRCKRGG